jgi:hypothetical protein
MEVNASSLAKVRRVDAYLDNLVLNKTISQQGKEWLVAAIDPFHDTDVKCDGYPDINIAPSVVQLVKSTVQISCPGTITTGTWDCNVVQLPFFTSRSYGSSIATGNILNTGETVLGNLGGIVAMGAQTGSSTALGTGIIINSAVVADSYFQGASRVVAAGFEVVNTTSPLNVQGQVIAYRQAVPPPIRETYVIVNEPTSDAFIGAASVATIPNWPSSTANALLLGGSRIWHAREGCYSVATLNSLENPAVGEQYVMPIFIADEIEGGEDTIAYIPTLEAKFAGPLSSPHLVSMAPLNMTGAYFSGLSLSTTLEITLNLYIERFPDYFETDLVVLAKPSPCYDPMALEMYCHALTDMPPGVMQKENGFGDWFSGVASKIADFAAPVLKAIPLPMTQMAGSAIDMFRGTDRAPRSARAIAPPNSQVEEPFSQYDYGQGGYGQQDEYEPQTFIDRYITRAPRKKKRPAKGKKPKRRG